MNENLFHFSFDPDVIDERLFKKIGIWDFSAIAFSISILIGFIVLRPNNLAYDFNIYLETASEYYENYYYAYWFNPVFELFAILPVFVSYFIWNMISIICVFLAARIFGGNSILALVSYQMCYILFQGQIMGWIIGALAFLWWGMTHRKWPLAGLCFLIAATKFQSGLVVALILWLLADITWKNRLQIIRIPILAAVVSLLIYPGWPFQLLSEIKNNPPQDLGNITLWQWIGPFALILWIPPLILQIPNDKRIIALISTTSLALPYFQQTDLLALFVFPIGWFPIAGNIGYLSIQFGVNAVKILAIIPLIIYLLIITPNIIMTIKSRHNQTRIYE